MVKKVDFGDLDWNMVPQGDKCKIYIAWDNKQGYHIYYRTLDDEYVECEIPRQLKDAITNVIRMSHIPD